MSSNFVYRVIKEAQPNTYDPSGVWREIRHTNSTLTSDSNRNRIVGLSSKKGITDSLYEFELVSGTISMNNTEGDLDFFMSVFSGNSKDGNTYDIGGDILSTLTIEQYDPEIDKSVLYRSVGIKSIQLAFSFGSISGLTVSFIGGYATLVDGRTSDQGTFVRGSDSLSVSATEDISIYHDNLLIPLFIQSGDILIDNDLQVVNPLGGTYSVPFGVGVYIPQGSISIYSDIEAFNLWKHKMDNSPFRIVFSNNDFDLTVYEAYLEGNLPTDNGVNTEVIINLKFEGIYDTANTKISDITFK